MLVSDETQVAYKRWIGEMGVHSDVLCLFLSSEGPPIVLMRTKKFAVNGDYLLPFSGIVGPLFRLLRR